MESITIYPENEKQKSLLKSLLKELKIRFEVEKLNSEMFLDDKEFIAKIDKSIKQFESGQTTQLSKQEQKDFLGL